MLRHKLQYISKSHVIFLDETALRVNEGETTTIVLPGEQEYVIVEDTTTYAKRFDVIACCNGKQVFSPKIFTPKERSDASVKGINPTMLLIYIEEYLAQALALLDLYPLYLVLDRASIHNEKEILDAFHFNGCQDMKEVIRMPTQAAKRMSPLDNALFHDWKQAIRKKGKITNRNIEQKSKVSIKKINYFSSKK